MLGNGRPAGGRRTTRSPAIHARILAIDYGRVRHGLAVSDGLGLLAHPLPALQRRSPAEDLAALRRLIEERGIERLLLGLPLEMHGGEGTMAREVRRFGDSLAASLGLPLTYEDERLSSDEAEQRLREGGLRPSDRKRRRDSVAALVILESVLQREARGPAGSGSADEPPEEPEEPEEPVGPEIPAR